MALGTLAVALVARVPVAVVVETPRGLEDAGELLGRRGDYACGGCSRAGRRRTGRRGDTSSLRLELKGGSM